ncbi:MAG: phosphatase PAP2 family protein [Pseudomonadales bacterium]|nr:phosphatase PAP2 family protein [Pseudomonadales bacterium]
MKILEQLHSYDQQLLLRCSTFRQPLFRCCKTLSHSADGYLYIVFALIYAFIQPQTGYTFLWLMLCIFFIERTIYFFLKNTLKRQRPPMVISGFSSLITASDEFSFPSGHTSAAFLFSTLCCLWFDAALVYLTIPWAFSIAFCRVALGVHFPFDTVAGALIGITIASSGYSLYIS